jgi:hypothetical protein
MTLKWPEQMPENGRLSQSDDAWMSGLMRVVDAKMSCQQTLNITLFFDGTNNNDAEGNLWRDSKKNTHTNVARLFNAALDDKGHGMFPFYIPGVGTPFPQIGEPVYSTDGKAFAEGFNQRCVWGYTRILNAVYNAIASDKTRSLIQDGPDAQRLCDAGARGDMKDFEPHLHRLGVAHRQAVDESAWPRTVKQIWINVIGFSRGAAGARAFVQKLLNEWAPGGRLGEQTGKYALPYQVNFMGLFDTVASVGLPDSVRPALNLKRFDGHSDFAEKGGLGIPEQVRFCVHAFSIHEQRMSFPLDSICKGGSHPGDCRHEIAYPGVHSDVGGGYAPGDQGKARNGDSSKLSQIPLHDMYIAALKYGVPLMRGDAIQKDANIASVFALHPQTVIAFNAWLKTVEPTTLSNIGDAMKFGMGQLLNWRTLRARIGTNDYVTEREFFSDSPQMTLVDVGSIPVHSARSALRGTYDAADDVISKPVREAIPFLTQHTSPEAVIRLQRSAQAAVDLFDDYVHDSRCWFRVPYFHEYAPGGYGWPRVVFVDNSDRVAWLGFDPLSVALNTEDPSKAAIA